MSEGSKSGWRWVRIGAVILVVTVVVYFTLSVTSANATENGADRIVQVTAMLGALAGVITALTGFAKVILNRKDA